MLGYRFQPDVGTAAAMASSTDGSGVVWVLVRREFRAEPIRAKLRWLTRAVRRNTLEP